MTTNPVQLLGIYTLAVSDEMICEQAANLYDEPSEEEFEEIRAQLASTVLIEVLVTDAGKKFRVDDFTQAVDSQPHENWQAAWAETFLSTDGESLLCERWASLPSGVKSYRVAFFLHEWQPGRPLITSFGELPTGEPQPMPERLQRLVPYEFID